MPPVCSPTEIIEITIGGNTFDLASGAAIVSPPAIDARDSMTALWITMFPAVRAVISRPSRIDTPEEMRVPSVRVNRDRSEEHTSELQSRFEFVCRLLLEKKKYHFESRLSLSCFAVAF